MARKHVFRDLRPYVCTFQDCRKPDRLFQSRHEWFDHELENHRREWFCNACQDPFKTRKLLIGHLTQAHPEVGAEIPVEVLADRCERVVDHVEPCPLCGGEYLPRQLQTHMGRHMQQLALFVLPNMCDVGESDGEEDSDDRGERTLSSILGSFHRNPDRVDLDEPTSSTPGGIENTIGLRDELTEPTKEATRAEIIDHGESQVEPVSEPMESIQATTHPVPNMTAAEHDCLAIFEEYIDQHRPGWRSFYQDRRALSARATLGVGMIEQLVRNGCDVVNARQLVLLTLCDFSILIGWASSIEISIVQRADIAKQMMARGCIPPRK